MALGKLKRRHRRQQRAAFSAMSGVDMSSMVNEVHERPKPRTRGNRPGKGSLKRGYLRDERDKVRKGKLIRNLLKTGTMYKFK